MRRTVFALSLLSTLTACDVQDPGYDLQLGLAPPPGAPAPGEGAGVDFREQGPPAALYITTVGGKPIHKVEFAALVNACWKVGDPPLTCTLSWYQPESTQPTFVLGLGCSEVATQAILDCYRTLFKSNGGKAI